MKIIKSNAISVCDLLAVNCTQYSAPNKLSKKFKVSKIGIKNKFLLYQNFFISLKDIKISLNFIIRL